MLKMHQIQFQCWQIASNASAFNLQFGGNVSACEELLTRVIAANKLPIGNYVNLCKALDSEYYKCIHIANSSCHTEYIANAEAISIATNCLRIALESHECSTASAQVFHK